MEGLERLILLPNFHDFGDGLPRGSVTTYDAGKHLPSSSLMNENIGSGILTAKLDINFNEKDLKEMTYNIQGAMRSTGAPGLTNLESYFSLYSLSGNPDGEIYMVLRSGGRDIDDDLPSDEYVIKMQNAREKGEENRREIQNLVSGVLSCESETISETEENFFEISDGRITYFKDALVPAKHAPIAVPSYVGGQAALITPNGSIGRLNHSLPSGTGRSEKEEGQFSYTEEIKQRVVIPFDIDAGDLRNFSSEKNGELGPMLEKLKPYIKETQFLDQIAFIT